MRLLRFLLAPLLLGLVVPAVAQDAVFPFETHVRDLDNGLRVVVVPTGYPDIVSLYVPVAVGSRNEVEPGKSGFAHFFEHMMFRGTETVSEEEYQQRLQRAGADQNAYTTDDRTVYHQTFTRADLEEMIALEADRFQHLAYSEQVFRTEALAVLGEYNKNYANPIQKLFEVQRAAAFREHTYRHTTMGFLEDIEVMPDQLAYSRTFFDRFYRPEYTTVIVAGDVDPDETFALVEQYWGGWERGAYVADIPTEPALGGPVFEHVSWETPTLPWVTVAFRAPAAYGDTDADVRALDALGTYAFGPASDLYRRLVVEEQLVDQLFAFLPDRVDPTLMTIGARLRSADDAVVVRDAIQQTLAQVRAHGIDADRLDAIKSNLRYGFAHSLDNSPAAASTLATYMANTRDVGTIEAVFAGYDALTPEAVQAAANRYLADEHMVVVTLAHEALPAEAMQTGSVDAHLATVAAPESASAETTRGAVRARLNEHMRQSARTAETEGRFEVLVEETASPLVDVRFLFGTGAASDPEGKEGLATLTARMIADAGSRTMTYTEIQRALFPMAAGFSAQVDKEMTVFYGRAHRDNLDAYYAIIRDQLLDPAFREEDFERVRRQLVNEVRVGLRANNDEELAKEVLYEKLYAGHRYGHLNQGHLGALEALTLNDVRAFYREHYVQDVLTLGLAGDVPEAFRNRVQGDLAALPASRPSAGGRPVPMAPVEMPPMPDGLDVTLVQKDTRAVALSLGFPIEVTRTHPDFVALWLVRSYFGEHRSSNAYLFQRIRGVRGMNYGDYAYIEYFPRGMYQFYPDANLGRTSQLFQMWIRPVPPEQAHFALRIALFELDRLVRDGMSEADFEATREFLSKYVAVLTQSQDRALGYALDARYYGTPAFTEFIRKGLEALTLEDVNRALRTHLQAENVAVVAVTPNAEAFRDALLADAPSPISYNTPMPEDVLAEDEVIATFPLALTPEQIRIVNEDAVFEARVFGTE